MEMNAFWAALLRRWHLTLAGLGLAIAVTMLIVTNIGPTYKAEGSQLLFPPITTTTSGRAIETQGNPYLMLGGLNQARDIVIRALNSRSVGEQFAQKEPLAKYDVTPDFATSGPIIVIDVSAPSPAAATAGLKTAMGMVPGTLQNLQSGLKLPSSAFITSRQLTSDKVPEIVRSSQIRIGIVVGVVIMGTVLLLLGLLDGLLKSRPSKTGSREARHARSTSTADPEDPAPTEKAQDNDHLTAARR